MYQRRPSDCPWPRKSTSATWYPASTSAEVIPGYRPEWSPPPWSTATLARGEGGVYRCQ